MTLERDIDTTHAVAGIDPHKHSATAAVVSLVGEVVARLSFTVTQAGIEELLKLLGSTGWSWSGSASKVRAASGDP